MTNTLDFVLRDPGWSNNSIQQESETDNANYFDLSPYHTLNIQLPR